MKRYTGWIIEKWSEKSNVYVIWSDAGGVSRHTSTIKGIKRHTEYLEVRTRNSVYACAYADAADQGVMENQITEVEQHLQEISQFYHDLASEMKLSNDDVLLILSDHYSTYYTEGFLISGDESLLELDVHVHKSFDGTGVEFYAPKRKPIFRHQEKYILCQYKVVHQKLQFESEKRVGIYNDGSKAFSVISDGQEWRVDEKSWVIIP